MAALAQLGPFSILDRIAVGGMGVVYRAQHDDGSMAALKLLVLQDDWDEVPAKLFIQEVQATARLHHDNVVAVLDYGELPAGVSVEHFQSGTPYYIMEYVPGGSLEQHPPNTFEQLFTALECLLQGLAHAHARGVIHRDIKPANLLHGEDGRVVLTDFGIAHATFTQTATLSDDLTTSTHEVASGTPLYMAPEQFTGSWRDYGPWTDLYALGILAWHFVCGRPPFAAKSFVELGIEHISKPLPKLDPQYEVPPRFAMWLSEMTCKDHRIRFQSAAAALAALRGHSPEADDWRALEAQHRVPPVRGTGLGLLGMREVPTVGREEERDQLWAAVCGARHGLQVARIDGPLGTGTSHLARWAAQHAAECGAATTYRVDNAADAPLAGLAGLLHAVFRTAGLEGEKLMERVLTLSEENGIDVPVRFAVDLMSATSGSLTAEQTFEPTARILKQLSSKHPIVLWFDDIDEAEELASFIAFLAADHADLHVVIIATAGGRPEGFDRSKESWRAIREYAGSRFIELGFMKDDEIERILRSQVTVPRRTLERTLARCQGSPMFAVLVLEEWVRAGRISPSSSSLGLDLETSAATTDLPTDISEVWARRIDGFVADLANIRILEGDKMRVASSPGLVFELLETAATLGQQVDEHEWSQLREARGLRRISFLVNELVRHRLARRTPHGFQFVHGLLRDAIVSRANSNGRWAELNLAAADMLRAVYGQGDARLPLRIAHHLNEAGDHLAAMADAEDAAFRARDAFDVVSLGEATRIWAASAARAKLEPNDLRLIDLWTMQAYARLLGASPEDRSDAATLMQSAQDAVAASEDTDAMVRVAARRAVAALYLGEIPQRASELLAVLELDCTRSTQFEARMALARAFAATGRTDQMFAAAQAATRAADNDAQRMQSAQLTARALLELGRLEEARDTIDAANTLARENNWVIAEARGYETRAFIADAANDFAAAALWHTESLELFELVAPRTSYPARQREYLARALLASGQTEAASRHLARVRDGLDSGRIGFWTHIEDAELACAAAAEEWDRCEELLETATTFERFKPYEIHLRALALAHLFAERQGKLSLADRIRLGLDGLGDAAAEIEAARCLI